MKRKYNLSIIIVSAFCCFAPVTAYGAQVFYTYDEVGNMVQEYVTDLHLQSDTINAGEVQAHKTTNSITAGPSYIIKDDASVTLKAGNIITLTPGFKSEAGSYFRAAIE